MTNAFTWNTGEPSIFASDRKTRATSTGKSHTQVATEAIAMRKQRGEKSPGRIAGIDPSNRPSGKARR